MQALPDDFVGTVEPRREWEQKWGGKWSSGGVIGQSPGGEDAHTACWERFRELHMANIGEQVGQRIHPSWRLAAVASSAIVAIGLVTTGLAQQGLFDRHPGPVTEEDVRSDLAEISAAKDPMVFVTPPPADPGPIREFGPYRLVPFGYTGDLPFELIPIPKGIQSSDPSVVRASPLYREVSESALPEPMMIAATSTGVGDTESEIHLRYVAMSEKSRSIDVSWGRVGRRPINVNLPKQGVRTMVTRMVGSDMYALMSEGHAKAPDGSPGSRLTLEVRVGRGSLEAWVSTTSSEYGVDDLLRIAQDVLR